MIKSKSFFWYINRLKAMSIPEVYWRLNQSLLHRKEKARFDNNRHNVGKCVFNPKFKGLLFDYKKLGINFSNKNYNTHLDVHLFKGIDYEKWPDIFSYKLNYKQRDDLGDARTNWEKNRHFDWVLLAKAYYVTGDIKQYKELENKVKVWCNVNSFLHGISWTSAMEFAIRAVNWMFSLAFIQATGRDIPELRVGIINMIEYLTRHYSCYSSGNNHLLIEASAIGIAGYAFNCEKWKILSKKILTSELYRQNYTDGVNKELSLHYQTFGMEAYLLLAHISMEDSWNEMLMKQAEFVSHSIWREKIVCEFGDDDEGKILDLQGGEWNYWEWILQLVSLVTGKRYTSFNRICENTYWLFTEEEISKIKHMPIYKANFSRCFTIGGNSFLRDYDDRVLIGIDHAALGFGSIAAHGHADALSFQMFIDGNIIFADPGTYIYHCDLLSRNSFRKTINHNTITINGKDQSEMIGAFMWGRKANCNLVLHDLGNTKDLIIAEHDGYLPIKHKRAFDWNKNNLLIISDELSNNCNWTLTFILGKECSVSKMDNYFIIICKKIQVELIVEAEFKKADISDCEISERYGVKEITKVIRITGTCKNIKSIINIKKNE